jgi:hypothetical protein
MISGEKKSASGKKSGTYQGANLEFALVDDHPIFLTRRSRTGS